MSEFDELSKKIDELKTAENEASPTKEVSGYSIAMRMSVELLAGVLVGAALGYGMDHWFGTSPWILIVMIFLGFAAGILNMKRSMDLLDKGQQ